MKLKLDKFFWIGLTLGFIFPLLLLLFFKNSINNSLNIKESVQWLFMFDKPKLTKLLTMSLLLNAVMFSAFIHFDKDNLAKGIFVATMFYAIIAILFKWVL